jgi:hypothetical protein
VSKPELSTHKAKPLTTIVLDGSGDLRRLFKAGATSITPSAASVITRGIIG